MKRSAATIILIVDIHVFVRDEIPQWTRLVTLGSDMQHISSIHILNHKVCTHVIHHQFYELDITVICRKVQSDESFICWLIDPLLDSLVIFIPTGSVLVLGSTSCDIILYSVPIDILETFLMVLKRSKREGGVHPRFFKLSHVDLALFSREEFL